MKNFRSVKTTFYSLGLLLFLELAWGFSTKKCEYHELMEQVQLMHSCSNKSNHKLIDAVLKEYRDELPKTKTISDLSTMCRITQAQIKGHIICGYLLVTRCFDKKIADLFFNSFRIFEGSCDIGNILTLIFKDGFMSGLKKMRSFDWTHAGIVNKMKLSEFYLQTIKTIGRHPENIKYLTSTITSEKNCTNQEIAYVLFQIMICSWDHRFDSAMGLPEAKLGSELCNYIGKNLRSCFYSNRCFSQREMDLLRNLYSTFYKNHMESFLHVTKNHSSFAKYVTYLRENEKRTKTWRQAPVVNTNISISKSISHFVDHAMEDFKSEHCKTNLQNYSHSPVPDGEFMKYHTLHLISVILCEILIAIKITTKL